MVLLVTTDPSCKKVVLMSPTSLFWLSYVFMSLLLRAAVDVDVDSRPHCNPPKFRQGLVYSLHKSGGGKFVGLPNEETEPSELGLPLGEGNSPVLFFLARRRNHSRLHRRCAFTLAAKMADGQTTGRSAAISTRAVSMLLYPATCKYAAVITGARLTPEPQWMRTLPLRMWSAIARMIASNWLTGIG